MRASFVMMMLLLILIGYDSRASEAAATGSKLSCTQRILLESIGGKNLRAEGSLEEIASAYADAVLINIKRISEDAGEIDHRDKAYQSFEKEVLNQLDWRVYHDFVANLRSRNFIFGRMDKLENAIHQWGGDLALGLAVATPIVSVIGSGLWFFHHGDFVLAFSLPPAATAAGAISAILFKSLENQIHRESQDLSVQFKILVGQKLHEKFMLSLYGESGLASSKSSGDSKQSLREIMDNAYKYYFAKKWLGMIEGDGD
ncbi:MAG: hypothetical protein IPK68_23315 [Bdellovibrionales bacterium]|nr:hypothetical protein [Bdellovibrionales bacterium]